MASATGGAGASAGSVESPLQLLLSAPSKDAVAKFFNACFRYRHAPEDAATSRHVLDLGLAPEQSAKLVSAGVAVLTAVLYDSADIGSPEQVAARLPAGLDARLSTLVSGIIFAGLPMWRDAAIEGRIGPPKLVASSWEVNVVEGSSDAGKTAVPTCILGLRLQEAPTLTTAPPAERTVNVELNHASLTALLEGMRRVRDQLAACSR